MKRWHWLALGAVVLLSVALDLLTPHDPKHAQSWWKNLPAFYAFFGFIGCVATVFFSRALGKLFLQRKEEYYNAD